MQEQRDFKGVWIPKEIWLNNELSMLEKVIYTEIDSLDNENHCTAGNDYFAQFCNCSESAVSKAIRHLTELEYIRVLNFDGRHRTLSVLSRVVKFTKQNDKIYDAESQILRANNISNKTSNKKALIDKSINAKSEKTDSEIYTFVELYHQICTDLPKCVKLTEKREKAIKKLIKRYSLEDIKAVFTKAQKSSFLTGKNDRGWKADIDFILREDKFISILEGKYDCKSKSKSNFDTYDDERKKVDKIQFREEIKNGKSEKF